MANRTENVLADLATLFNNHADKVQAVPSVTALDLDSVRRIIKEELAKMPVQAADNTVKTVFNICLNVQALTEKRYEYAGILAGDIFLAGHDDDGNTTSIELSDVPELKRVLQTLMLTNQERQEKLQRFMEVSDNV